MGLSRGLDQVSYNAQVQQEIQLELIQRQQRTLITLWCAFVGVVSLVTIVSCYHYGPAISQLIQH